MIPLFATGQTNPNAGSAPAPPPELHAWSVPELHLTYSYPAELTARDGAFAVAAGNRMLYDEDAHGSRAKGETCAKVLLSVGMGREGSKGSWTRLGVLSINGKCFPEKMLRNKKAVQLLLRNLVSQGTTVMGTMPLEVPTGYELGGHWASFCAAQGQPVTADDVQASDQQLDGIIAVALEDELIAWVIETNDDAMFNQLLGSRVDFGTGGSERLSPVQVQ
jgi:hypothetical protein